MFVSDRAVWDTDFIRNYTCARNRQESGLRGTLGMAKKKVSYGNYYKVGQQVKVGIQLSGTVGRESNGEITAIDDDRVAVEILGGVPASLSGKKGDSRFSLSGWSGWGFFRCDAIPDGTASAMELKLRLVGDVEERQRREYFRLDVSLPVLFEIPPAQSPVAIRERWNSVRSTLADAQPPKMIPSGQGYRVILPDGGDIPSQSVNLSGGGLRMRMPEAVAVGHLLQVEIFLPLAPPRVIPVVAEVLRCNEVTLRLEKEPVFITAMKFIHIDDKDREAIIAYLFAEQRNQLQAEADRADRGR